MNKQTLGTDTIHRHSFGQKNPDLQSPGFTKSITLIKNPMKKGWFSNLNLKY